MRHKDITEEQKQYKSFDKRRQTAVRIMIILLVIILICFVLAFRMVDETPTPLIITTGILVAYTAVLVFICIYIARKHIELHTAAYGNDSDTIHTGLFGELWEEFEFNQFEGLTKGKVVFAEACNDTIEIDITYHKHEFIITIDKDAVYMIIDEETDNPVEKEVHLSEMNDIGQVFTVIREFIEDI